MSNCYYPCFIPVINERLSERHTVNVIADKLSIRSFKCTTQIMLREYYIIDTEEYEHQC